jgi:hypothetical protein
MLTVSGAVVLGQLLFLAVTSNVPGPTLEGVSDWSYIRLGAPIFALSMIAIGMFLFRRHVSRIASEESQVARVGRYRTAFLLRMSMINGGGFASLLAYFFSRDPYFLMVMLPMLALQIFLALKASDTMQIAPLFETR